MKQMIRFICKRHNTILYLLDTAPSPLRWDPAHKGWVMNADSMYCEGPHGSSPSPCKDSWQIQYIVDRTIGDHAPAGERIKD